MTQITPQEQEQLVDLAVKRLEGQCMVASEEALEDAALALHLPVDAINDQRVLELLDDQVFWCDECGWCCSTEELNNEGMDNLCDDCKGDEE